MANEGKEPEMEDRMKKFYKKGIGVALAVTMADPQRRSQTGKGGGT